MTFHSFLLDPKILQAVEDSGYTEPTLIQLEAIPKILAGLDIRGSAQTGTGKTAAFLLPSLHRLVTTEPKKGRGPRLLILVPTRELGMQIATQAEKYSKYLKRIKIVSISGGIPYHKQLPKLSAPYDVLIATPGRLIDFLDQGKITLSRLEVLVLDEADRMLDMGFLQPVEEIAAATPEDRQTLLFSATLGDSIQKLSRKILKDPVDISVHNTHAKHENIDQKLLYVDDLNHKNELLDHILNDKQVFSSIIFTSTKRHAHQLFMELDEKGHKAGTLHGDMDQRKRTRTINSLRNGHIHVLVATDVAARGIDIDSITHVINFDLPYNPEDYVHRIGRTGRAGAKGTAFSFASHRDRQMVKRIEGFTKQPFEIITIAGLEPKQKSQNSAKEHPKRDFKKKSFHKDKPNHFNRESKQNSKDRKRDVNGSDHLSNDRKRDVFSGSERLSNDRKRDFRKLEQVGNKPKKPFFKKKTGSANKNSFSPKRMFKNKSSKI